MLQRGGVWAGATAEQAITHVARFYAEPWEPRELIDRLAGQPGRTPFRR